MKLKDLYEKGDELYERGENEAALRLLLPAARRGHARAMYLVGSIYHYGRTNDRKRKDGDAEKAYYWFTKAMEHGVLDAYYCVAYCHRWGDGAEDNDKKAFSILLKGALLGDKICTQCVAECFHYGIGVEKNYSKALLWFKKYVRMSDDMFLTTIGDYYLNGWGTNQNYKKAVEWYRKACENGRTSGQGKLGICYFNGWGVYKDVDKAIVLLEKAFIARDNDADEYLTELLHQRHPQVIEMFERLAAEDCWRAQDRLDELKKAQT